jgi:galactoside 2-L-fucosyltransferase 1/2
MVITSHWDTWLWMIYTYIRKAIDHFTRHFQNVLFIVCSDDSSWAKSHVQTGEEPVVFSPFSEPELDMCLMSKCNHTIMSTGTFSWWAAWLAGGQVVYPRKFPSPGTWLGKVCRREDYYLPDWTPL